MEASPDFLYPGLQLAHVLLFVYWLGADLAVLYGARYAANPELSPETRATVAEIMGFVDMFPRLSVPLIAVSGIQLAVSSGALRLPGAALWGASIAGIVWALNTVFIYRNRARLELVVWPKRLDLALRIVILVISLAVGIGGLLGAGPAMAPFVAIKLLLFAGAIALSLLLRWFFLPYRPALQRVLSGGGADEDNLIMRRALARTRPVVLALWSLTVVAAAVGLWRAPLGL